MSQTANMSEKKIYKSCIPSDLSGMYHYTGSLTTPGCAEIVQWIVLDKPIYVEENLVIISHVHITARVGA